MTTPDHFEAMFVLSIDRSTAWDRLTGTPLDDDRTWLPGFDGAVTVTELDDQARLTATKDDQPCAGTEIVVRLADAETGTSITVVQSGFGSLLPALYDVMAVGWRHIVADLQTYLATGVHAQRHLRPWGDLGADVAASDGALRVHGVRADTLADRLGLQDDDLLTALAGAPVSTHDDLVTVLRVVGTRPGDVIAEWIRAGTLVVATAAS